MSTKTYGQRMFKESVKAKVSHIEIGGRSQGKRSELGWLMGYGGIADVRQGKYFEIVWTPARP